MKYSGLFFLGFIIMSCINSTPRKPINKNKNKKEEYSVEFNRAVNKAQEGQIQKYIQKDSLSIYQNSSFGFVYTVLKSSRKKKNQMGKGTKVTFEKTVYSLKDELIYPTEKQTCVIGKSNEITGVIEGLKLMREDEEIKFIFTSFVAHGFNGDQNRIGRNIPIIVKIKLLNINN